MRLIYLYVWRLNPLRFGDTPEWDLITYGPCNADYVEGLREIRRYYQEKGYCTAFVRREIKFLRGEPCNT